MTAKSLKKTFIQRAVSQFGRPRGWGGRVAGWIMANRASNRQRNIWAVSVLDPRPTDRVLEIGFGPGVAIAEFAHRVTQGRVYGVDHSDLMVRQASRRNAGAIRAGRVELVRASVERMPDFGGPLDVILAVNSIWFWPDPDDRVRDLRGLLRPGGRLALVSQPRMPGATAETTAQTARELADRLVQAGFVQPRTETLALDPPVACVIATNP